MKVKELIGKKYNNFYIYDYKRENNRTFVLAECPYCNEKKWMRKDTLDNAKVISCGCYNAENNYRKAKEIKNKKIGFLITKEPTNKRNKNGNIIWKCYCTRCNTECFVSTDCLEKGVISCGCVQQETRSKNGKKAGEYIKENFCVGGTNIKNLTTKKSRRNTSGVKGVSWDKEREKWSAQIGFKGKNYHLGRFEKKEDAIKARKKAEEKIFGDFIKWYNEVCKKEE